MPVSPVTVVMNFAPAAPAMPQLAPMPAYASYSPNDYLIDDDSPIPPFPGEGPAPTLPAPPSGPVLPGFA